MKEKEKYGLYDGEYLVFKGTRHEICNEFKIGLKGFYEYLKQTRRLKGKYIVRHINGDEPIQKKPEPIIKTTDEERFEYLFSMLKMYGNTCSVFDPVPYFEKLKDKGIIAESRKCSFGGYYIEVTV